MKGPPTELEPGTDTLLRRFSHKLSVPATNPYSVIALCTYVISKEVIYFNFCVTDVLGPTSCSMPFSGKVILIITLHNSKAKCILLVLGVLLDLACHAMSLCNVCMHSGLYAITTQ